MMLSLATFCFGAFARVDDLRVREESEGVELVGRDEVAEEY